MPYPDTSPKINTIATTIVGVIGASISLAVSCSLLWVLIGAIHTGVIFTLGGKGSPGGVPVSNNTNPSFFCMYEVFYLILIVLSLWCSIVISKETFIKYEN